MTNAHCTSDHDIHRVCICMYTSVGTHVYMQTSRKDLIVFPLKVIVWEQDVKEKF